MTQENKYLAETAMCSVLQLTICYCESMAGRIARGYNLNNEMLFEVSNTVSAMSRMLTVLRKIAEEREEEVKL